MSTFPFNIPRRVLLLWLLHLVISLAFGLYLQANPELAEAPMFSTPDWAGNLAHWDVNWELSITDQGYGADFSPQTSAKFPLASLLARIQHQLFGLPIQVALFIVNKLGVLLGLWALWRLVAKLYDSTTADRSCCARCRADFAQTSSPWGCLRGQLQPRRAAGRWAGGG